MIFDWAAGIFEAKAWSWKTFFLFFSSLLLYNYVDYENDKSRYNSLWKNYWFLKVQVKTLKLQKKDNNKSNVGLQTLLKTQFLNTLKTIKKNKSQEIEELQKELTTEKELMSFKDETIKQLQEELDQPAVI